MFDEDQSTDNELIDSEIDGVSLIYLSFNKAEFLVEKIRFLIQELSHFKSHELIIIDDHSADDSENILSKFMGNEHVRIIINKSQKGIPHSMNLGVEEAKYEHVVFCDQRQSLSKDIIKKLVSPLFNTKTGAVSSCISNRDQKNHLSIMRAHENFIKTQEARSGNLIGVYGPLYAIKKACYSNIPSHIVLDDLYLSLKILETHQIKFLSNCKIFEKDPNVLYDYKRSKRYLFGLMQLINEDNLINQLSLKQIVMLIWHKYIRLFIPLFLFISYIGIGFKSFESQRYLMAFLLISVILLTSLFPKSLLIRFRLQSFLRINILYVIAFSELLFVDFLFRKYISRHVNT